jgi:hypothetical protein
MKVLALAALLLAFAAPAFSASSDHGDGRMALAFTEAEVEEPGDVVPTTTTVSEGGVVPAELAPAPEADEAEDAWTAKFLAPTVAILGVLGIAFALLLYGVKLRARYRVVE